MVKNNETPYNMVSHNFSDYTCKSNYDCHDKGYCHVGVCQCLQNYEYELDCSSYGCKYPHSKQENTHMSCNPFK